MILIFQERPGKEREQNKATSKGRTRRGCLSVGGKRERRALGAVLNQGQLEQNGGSHMALWKLGKVREPPSFLYHSYDIRPPMGPGAQQSKKANGFGSWLCLIIFEAGGSWGLEWGVWNAVKTLPNTLGGEAGGEFDASAK